MTLRSRNAYILMYTHVYYCIGHICTMCHIQSISYIRKIDDIQSIIVDTSFVFHDIHDVLQKYVSFIDW